MFFDWAKAQWPELQSNQNLPTQPNIIIGELTLPALTMTCQAFEIPNDVEELKEKYVGTMTQLNQSENELLEALPCAQTKAFLIFIRGQHWGQQFYWMPDKFLLNNALVAVFGGVLGTTIKSMTYLLIRKSRIKYSAVI